jgi:ribosome-binding protein aMBF1 (putative translation factor)
MMIGYTCRGCGVEPPRPCVSGCPQRDARALAGAESAIALRALREARGLSAEELALRMAMDPYVVLDLERDPTFRGFDALSAYLDALDLRLELVAVDSNGTRVRLA